jgi:hypothetical protein
VDVTLTMATLGACLHPLDTKAVHLATCGSGAVGSLHGRGNGFYADREATQSFFAAIAGGNVHGPIAGPFEWSAKALAILPLARDGFGVDGGGTAFRLPTVGILGAAGLGASIR